MANALKDKAGLGVDITSLKCWNAVKEMIDDSVPAMKIVRFIQEDSKELKAFSPNYLQRLVLKYIKNNQKYVQYHLPNTHADLYRSLNKEVSSSEMFQVLMVIQFDRLMMEYSQEVKKGHTNKDTNQHVKLLTEILSSMTSTNNIMNANKSSDMEENIERIKSKYVERYGPRIATVLFNPESRRKIMNVIDMMKAGMSDPIQNAEQSTKVQENKNE